MAVDAITSAGARPVVHSCASDVPVALLAGAGFTAISFDASLAHPDDTWSEVFEGGTDLWPGVVPSDARRQVDEFFSRLGFDEEAYDARTVVTPPCGLAGASPGEARRTLTLVARVSDAAGRTGEGRDR
jgi:hypothetical protein